MNTKNLLNSIDRINRQNRRRCVQRGQNLVQLIKSAQIDAEQIGRSVTRQDKIDLIRLRLEFFTFEQNL